MSGSGPGRLMRVWVAAIGSAVALGAIAQTIPDQVQAGLERAIKTPTEILWLRDEILAELWRRNPQIADNYGACTEPGAAKKGCTIGERPAWRYALGSGSAADSRFRPLTSGVYLVAPQADNAALIRAPSGEIVLAAGASVQLIDAAYPGIRIELSAPPDQPLPLGNLSAAEAGRVFALLARPPGMTSANAASALGGGRVAFKSPAGDAKLVAARQIEPLALKPVVTLTAPVAIAAMASAPPAARPTEFHGTIDVSRAQIAAVAMTPPLPRSVEFRGAIDVSRVMTGEHARLMAQAGAKRAAELVAHARPPVVDPDLARLRAEVEAEIERDRARIASAQQQACSGILKPGRNCTIGSPRRFTFAG